MIVKCVTRFAKLLLTTSYYLLVAFPIIVSAAEVTLQWDANEPAPEGYRLFMRQSGEAFDYSEPFWSGVAPTHEVQGLTAGSTYFFVVRAYVDEDESGDSNEVEYTVPQTDPPVDEDSDNDGINDTEDAFPDDPSEWLDTDGDGTGNNTDLDDDGDGMPDSWEAQYEGLDPLVDDASGDLDEDGVSNLDEFENDSDPITYNGNTAPDTPVLEEPADGAIVDLSPSLNTGAYYDADGDVHTGSQYQIATENDFAAEAIVYDHTSDSQLTGMTVVDLVLDPETDYYWRVRFYDYHNGVSDWSEPFLMTTVDYETAGDSDADGVLESQQIDAETDVDGDGTPDLLQDDILSVNTPDANNPQMAVKTNSNDAHIVAIKAYQSDGLGLADNQPDNMTGLVSFKLHLDQGVTEASVTVYFSEPAANEALWYKYDLEDGWGAYTNATFAADRRSVTIELQDGGIGDQDGVQNGVIVDPAGLGYSSSTADSPNSDSAVEVGAGCFIVSTSTGYTFNQATAVVIWTLMAVLGVIAWAIAYRWREITRR